MSRTQRWATALRFKRVGSATAPILSALILSAATLGLLTWSTAPAQAAARHHKTAHVSKSSKDAPPLGTKPIYESIVVDANSGRVLHQVNADVRSYPASLTKMMTLYMLFDALQKGKAHLDTPIQISEHAASMAPSKLDLAPGSTIAVEQAIYAVVTKSANDVAVAIAEHLGGGSEERFCAMMTARAHAIGMTRTHFADASGLPNKAQLSTARDMAILGKRLMTEFPQYFAYFSRTEFPFRGQMIRTHNHLLENYDGADGIKTGYTVASGFNLVASARRGDQRLITVVFGGTSAKARDQHVAALMDAGFTVLANNPTAIASAQALDPFPSVPEAAPATTETATEDGASTPTAVAAATPTAPTAGAPMPVTAPASVPAAVAYADEDVAQAAGDADDAIARKLASTDVAPPLAATNTLVPQPGTKAAKGMRAPKTIAVAIDAPPANSSWGIQIGAYANRTVAENRAGEARAKVQTKFASAATRIVPVKVKRNVLYRAQVVGLNRKELPKACSLIAKIAHAGCKPVSPDPMRMAMR